MPKLEAAIDPAGRVTTVNGTPLLAVPSTVTMTLPVVAPDGTFATIDQLLQVATAAIFPLKVTDPADEPTFDEPKFDPVIVTEAPATPEVGLRLMMLGGAVTTFEWEVPPQPQRKQRKRTSTSRAIRVSKVAPEQAGVRRLSMDELPDARSLNMLAVTVTPTWAESFGGKFMSPAHIGVR